MTQATVAEVKSHLDRYLSLVRKGTVVRIMDRNSAIAELVPMPRPATDRRGDIAQLDNLEKSGVIRRGTNRMARELLDKDPPGAPCGVLDALLSDRDGQ